MKHLLPILTALCLLSAPAAAQTVKALSYNVSNNVVVAATNTNALTFTGPVTFSNVTTGTTIRSLSVELNMGGTGGSNLVLWSAIYFDDIYSNDIQAKSRANLGFSTNLNTLWEATNAATGQAALFAATNAAPTNTTNVSAWVGIQVGTNTYKLPLYQ